MTILDSGERREFETGAVRDMSAGKGRFDLMPLDIVFHLMEDNAVLGYIQCYVENGKKEALKLAADCLIVECFPTSAHAMLELAKHFEKGMEKYGVDNWKKGIETRSYVDSAVRHFCKYKAGYDDEPHAVACLWNLVCCIWTIKNKPELNSYPVEREEE